MRIFFVHQFYRTPTEGGCIRSYYVILELLRRGHEVILLRDANDQKPDKSNYTEERYFNQLQIVCLPVNWSNSLSFIARMIAFIKYLLMARREMKNSQFDLVYSVSVPLSTGLLALWSKKPFIFEVGDLWPDVPVQMGILKNPLLKWYSRKLEKRIYRNARLIISLSNDILKNIYSKDPGTANIVIPNFSDPEIFDNASSPDHFESLEISKGKIICSYTGTAGQANDLKQMVNLARLAEKKYPDFIFCIMAEGKELDQIKKSAPPNLIFLPFGNKWEAAKLISITDYNFICYAQYSLLGTGSPNKFFDGLAAGALSVINVKGWISDILEIERVGLFWNVNNSEELLQKMNYLVETGEIEDFKKRAQDLSEKFDQKYLSGKIADQIEMRF